MDVKLKTKHIIMLSKLVTKLNLNMDLSEKDNMKLGMTIVNDLVSKIGSVEQELYELIGSITSNTPEEVAEMEIDDLIDVLKVVVNKIINFIRSKPAESTTSI